MRENKEKKLLNKVKATYNLIANEFSDSRHANWEEFAFFSKYLFPNCRMIDLGCGNGRLINFLEENKYNKKKSKYHYLGVDNSENLIEKAKTLHPNHKFILGDQLAIPEKNNSTDLIFNIAAFHHIPSPKLQIQALKEMKRVLKKDGIIIITVWNLWQKRYIKSIIKAGLKWLFTLGYYRFNDLFVPWGKEKIPRYYHAFLPTELQKIVQKAELEIMEIFAVKGGKKVKLGKSNNICLIAKKI